MQEQCCQQGQPSNATRMTGAVQLKKAGSNPHKLYSSGRTQPALKRNPTDVERTRTLLGSPARVCVRGALEVFWQPAGQPQQHWDAATRPRQRRNRCRRNSHSRQQFDK